MKKTLLGLIAMAAVASAASVTAFKNTLTKNSDAGIAENKKEVKGEDRGIIIKPGKTPVPGVFYDIPASANPTKIDGAFYFEKLGNRHASPSGNRALVATQVLFGYYDTFENDNLVSEQFDYPTEENIVCSGAPTVEDFTQSPGTTNAFMTQISYVFDHVTLSCDEDYPPFREVVDLVDELADGSNVYHRIVSHTGDFTDKINNTIKARVQQAIDAGRPTIVSNEDFYVVAYGYDSTYVYVQDCNFSVKRLAWTTFDVSFTSTTYPSYIDLIIDEHEHSNNYVDLNTGTYLCPCGYGLSNKHVDLYSIFDTGESYGVGWRHRTITQGDLEIEMLYQHAARDMNDDTMVMYRSSTPDVDPEATFKFNKLITKLEFDYVPTYFGDQHVADNVVLKVAGLVKNATTGEYSYTAETVNAMSDSVFEPMHFSQTFPQGIVGYKLKVELVDGMPSTEYHASVSEMEITCVGEAAMDNRFVTYIDDGDIVESETSGSVKYWTRETKEYDTSKVEMLFNSVRSVDYAISMFYEDDCYRDCMMEFVFDREICQVEFDNYGTYPADQLYFNTVSLKMYSLRMNESGNYVWTDESANLAIGNNWSSKAHHQYSFKTGTIGFKLVLDSRPGATNASCDVSFDSFTVTHSLVSGNYNTGYDSELHPMDLFLEWPFTNSGTNTATVDHLNTLYSYSHVQCNYDDEMELFFNGTDQARAEFFFDTEIIGIEFDARYNSLSDYYNRNMFKFEFYYWNYIDEDHGSWVRIYNPSVGNPYYPNTLNFKLGLHVTGIKFVVTAPDSGTVAAGQVNIGNIKLVHSTEFHKVDLP